MQNKTNFRLGFWIATLGALIFLPNLAFYGILLRFVRRVDARILVVGLFSGIAMVLAFMCDWPLL